MSPEADLPIEESAEPPKDYGDAMKKAGNGTLKEISAYLTQELPYLWRNAYIDATSRVTSIMRVSLGTFEYIFDDYQALESGGFVPYHPTAESRLVAVHGASAPSGRRRDDRRLRKWVGPTETVFGKRWDKGHFMGHCLGGAVDGFEANVFVQRRDFNRGWSEEGIRFRAMEKYCVARPGTYCFSRPIYSDDTSRPTFVEFGILRQDRTLLVETFQNHY